MLHHIKPRHTDATGLMHDQQQCKGTGTQILPLRCSVKSRNPLTDLGNYLQLLPRRFVSASLQVLLPAPSPCRAGGRAYRDSPARRAPVEVRAGLRSPSPRVRPSQAARRDPRGRGADSGSPQHCSALPPAPVHLQEDLGRLVRPSRHRRQGRGSLSAWPAGTSPSLSSV